MGKEEKEIGKIFVALDVTEETLEQAVEAGRLIDHAPSAFIFSGKKRLLPGILSEEGS